MKVSPGRSILASIAAGSCLASAVVVGGLAAGGALPWHSWPGSSFGTGHGGEVALAAPAARPTAPAIQVSAAGVSAASGATPVPVSTRTTQVAAAGEPPTSIGAGSRARREERTTSRLPASPRSTTQKRTPPTTETPAPPAAAPVEDPAPPAPVAVARATSRKLTLSNVTTSFASASETQSGQPELKVTMQVADVAAIVAPKTVALSLRLSQTQVDAFKARGAGDHRGNATGVPRIALSAQVDVVDATSTTVAGEPACSDGTCVRVQMSLAATTADPGDTTPQVEVTDDQETLSNSVKVTVPIDTSDLAASPDDSSGQPGDPAPAAGTPSVVSLPLTSSSAPDGTPTAPATDSTTVVVPDAASSSPGAGDAGAVTVQAQLDIIDPPAAPTTPAPPVAVTQTSHDAPAAAPADAEPDSSGSSDGEQVTTVAPATTPTAPAPAAPAAEPAPAPERASAPATRHGGAHGCNG